MDRGASPEGPVRQSAATLVPLAVAVFQAVVVLGSALGRGVVIRYDMAWSPDPRWTPFVLGLDTPAPRAVPSDALAVLLGQLVGAGLAQKVILLGLLVLLGTGASCLVRELSPTAGVVPRAVATVAAVWNPFVYERLMVGQWTVLAGLAILPWVLREVHQSADGRRNTIALAALTAVAGLGGANTLVTTLGAALPALFFLALVRRDRPSLLALLVTAFVGLGVAAVWALPAFVADAHSDAAGAAAFAPRADTPLGVIGSLASGGGFWNAAVHPAAREVLLVAVASAALTTLGVVIALVTGPRFPRSVIAMAVGVPSVLVIASVVAPLEPFWVFIVTELPGGGLLRDSHKLIAPWMVLGAAGMGLVAEVLQQRIRRGLRGPVLVLLLLIPVALAPFQIWGGLGELKAVQVPADYRGLMAALNAAPPGDVGLLPWNQYRRYPWNDNQVSLTLAPRMLTRVVLFDDSLPLGGGVVPGENARAAQVTAELERGRSPVEALAAAGVRFIVVERTTAGEDLVAQVREAGQIVGEGSEALAIDLGGQADGAHHVSTRLIVVGGLITLTTWGIVLVACVTRHGLLRKR